MRNVFRYLFSSLLCGLLGTQQLLAQNPQEISQLVDEMLQPEGNGAHIIMNTGTAHFKDGTTETGTIRYQIGTTYSTMGYLQLISESRMKPAMIYPSEVTYVEIGQVKFFPIKIKTDKGTFTVFAPCLSKSFDDKMAMFRIYLEVVNSNSSAGPGISLQSNFAVITADDTYATLLTAMGGSMGMTPFHKYFSKLVESCPELAKKIKNKDDGYKVSLIDMKGSNTAVYYKVVEEFNACK